MSSYANSYRPVPFRYEAHAFTLDGSDKNGPIRTLGHVVWTETEANPHTDDVRRGKAFFDAIECARLRKYSLLLGHRREQPGAGFVAEYVVHYLLNGETTVDPLEATDRLNLRHPEAAKP